MLQDFSHTKVSLFSGCKTSGKHAKRSAPKTAVSRVRITSRDEMVLHALHDMKFLRTSQIATLCFGRLNSTVRLRLRRLLDGGLVKTWVTALNEENVYSLTKKSLAVLGDGGFCEGSATNVPRRMERHLDHLLEINDFRINLTLAISAQGGAITKWRSEWQVKRLGQQGIIPDAMFHLRLQEEEMIFALEADLGGEPAKTVFAEKLRHYVARRLHDGVAPDCLLVVTTTTRRLFTLLDTAAQEPGTANFLFTIRGRISQDSVLGKIWTSTQLAFAKSEPVFVSLLDLFGQEGGERNG